MSEITHKLRVGEEYFDIKHNNKRLYKFINWNSARDSLIRILLAKIKETHDVETAYIFFRMANPMRRSRLGNFYIDIDATVSIKGEEDQTLEEMGLNNIAVVDYDPYDEEEVKLRVEVEERYSSVQYLSEFQLRKKSLEQLIKEGHYDLNFVIGGDDLDKLVANLLDLEGWSETQDNRIHARVKRLPQSIDLSIE